MAIFVIFGTVVFFAEPIDAIAVFVKVFCVITLLGRVPLIVADSAIVPSSNPWTDYSLSPR